jgi:hypothetical protein
MREVDRLAIECGLTFARIRGPVSGHFTWSADEPMPLLLASGGAGARAADIGVASSGGA